MSSERPDPSKPDFSEPDHHRRSEHEHKIGRRLAGGILSGIVLAGGITAAYKLDSSSSAPAGQGEAATATMPTTRPEAPTTLTPVTKEAPATTEVAPAPDSQSEFFEGTNIEIQSHGNGLFAADIKQALWLLQDRAPDYFQNVDQYLKVIEFRTPDSPLTSGTYAFEEKPRTLIGPNYLTAGPIWDAAVILCETKHVEQYQTAKASLPPGAPIPDAAWMGPQREAECMKYAYDGLVEMKAPDNMLQQALLESSPDWPGWQQPQSDRDKPITPTASPNPSS